MDIFKRIISLPFLLIGVISGAIEVSILFCFKNIEEGMKLMGVEDDTY